MKIAIIRQQIELNSKEKDSKIKDAVFAGLSKGIENYQKLFI